MGRTRVIVTITKNYTYPKGCLDKRNPYEDAKHKAFSDFNDNMKENQEDPIRMFKVEVEDDNGWQLRKTSTNKKPVHDRGKFPTTVDLNRVLRALTESTLEKEIGELNPERNVDIFYKEERYGEDGQRVMYYLHDKHEARYNELYDEYFNKLSRILI